MFRKIATPYKVTVRRLASSTASHPRKAILQLVRFDPETNKTRVESYEYDKHHDYMVLDLITAVKAHQDPSLAFRASCCEGVCGSCAMNINGINSLACITFAQNVTTVGPLPNFPVIKDFVVDLRHFFQQYAYIRPFVRNTSLSRNRIDTIVERYEKVCKTLNGPRLKEDEAPELEPASTEVLNYLRLIDALREAGNVTFLLHALECLESKGVRLQDEEVKKLVEETIKQHADNMIK